MSHAKLVGHAPNVSYCMPDPEISISGDMDEKPPAGCHEQQDSGGQKKWHRSDQAACCLAD